MSRVLTTTTYGVLGLLAVRPYSTYELAKAMKLSVGRVWPRAESKLFEEPKKLVEHGYARAREETVGRRRGPSTRSPQPADEPWPHGLPSPETGRCSSSRGW